MVRSDKAGAGVIFTIDTETGFPETVGISAAWGLGDIVVKGAVNDDEYTVFKPFLPKPQALLEKVLGAKEKKIVYARGRGQVTKQIAVPKKYQTRFVLDDKEILKLAEWACLIEQHYRCPMDVRMGEGWGRAAPCTLFRRGLRRCIQRRNRAFSRPIVSSTRVKKFCLA